MMLNITRSLLLLIFCTLDLIKGNKANDKDPFRSLGIPDINPKDLLEEVEKEVVKKQESTKNLPKLKSIDDLPTFLKNNNMNEEDAVKMLTRFLIQDDITLKKYGAIFDQTGFDGLPPEERIAPLGTEERLQQRARSAATIWV